MTTGTLKHTAPQHGANYRQDPSERRTGDAPSDELAQVIVRTVTDALALTDDSNVARKKASAAAPMEEAINNIRGAVMIVYPMGLPDYDHVRQVRAHARAHPPAPTSRRPTPRVEEAADAPPPECVTCHVS